MDLLISSSVTWIRAENVMVERGECDISCIVKSYCFPGFFCSQNMCSVLHLENVHLMMEILTKDRRASASTGSNVNVRLW